MIRFHTALDGLLGRSLAVALSVCSLLLGCPPSDSPLGPRAGAPEYQERAFVDVPGGRVNVAGGNLLVRRVDLSLDTRLGTREIGAVYNSASGTWMWSFDVTYDGRVFVDPTGAVHDVGALADGEAVPGTRWVKVDARRIKTKGGLLHRFDPTTGRLLQVRWTGSSHPRLVFEQGVVAGEERALRVLQCPTATTSCTVLYTLDYDGSARPTRITDHTGRVADFAWDAAGNLAVARDGLDTDRGWAGFRYGYSGTLLTALTNSEGERIEYGYTGSRISRIRPIGGPNPVYDFSYAGKGDNGLYRTTYVDPTGVERRYAYDGQRRLFGKELVAAGETTTWTWRGLRPSRRVDPGGVQTSWTYAGDDVATEQQPSGNLVGYTYAPGAVDREQPSHRPIQRIDDSVGLVEERTYDSAGRLVQIRNGAGDTTTFTYDGDEMLATVTRPNGVVVELSRYGVHGHAQKMTIAGRDVLLFYDAVGNALGRSVGPAELGGLLPPEPGGVVTRSYDADRNLASLALTPAHPFLLPPPPVHVTVEHRSDGRRARILRPQGADHELDYDALGRLTTLRERVDGGWRATTFEHDAAGRRTAVTRPNGMGAESTYDRAGRLVAQVLLRGGVVEGTADYTYQEGRVASIRDSLRGGVESYGYDAAGRLVAIGFAEGESLAIDYDLRSRRTGEQYLMPGGGLLRDLGFGYDGADRRTTVVDGGAVLLDRTYRDGQLASVQYGNGLTRVHGHDASGVLVSTRTTDDAGFVVEDTTVTRSAGLGIGAIDAVTTTAGASPATTVERYWITPVQDETASPSEDFVPRGDRLIAWEDDLDGQGPFERLYDYDALSNRIPHPHSADVFLYNAERNRLLSADVEGYGQLDYTYDEAGYVTSRAGVPITWTAAGRVASVGADTFQWDMLGRPISRTVEGATVRWRFGGRVQADADGVPLAISEPEYRIDLRTGTHRYRHLDFRGNVKFVTDDAGRVLTHYQYSGYAVEQVLGDPSDPVRFVGRHQIGDLMILGARVYDPAVSRFLSPDPVLNLVNQYAYTLGNPVYFQDPDGSHSGLGFWVEVFMALGTTLIAGGFLAAAAGNPGAGALFATGVALLLIAALWHSFESAVMSSSGFATAGFSTASPAGGSPVGGLRGGPVALGSVAGGDGSSSGGGGCSPTALTRVPNFGWLLLVLVSLQLLLGSLALRQMRS